MKNFVKVIVSFDCDGTLTPNIIIWNEKQRFNIDKITDIRYTSSPQDEKAGIRYTCLIHGQQRYLFYENSRWFVITSSGKAVYTNS